MNYTNRNQNIDIYFREIARNASMTRDDEIALFTRISKGDKTAETEIFNKMAKLAVAVAKTYTGDDELLEDLIQEANIGVLEAIYKFDLSTGWRFSSYARFWMKSMISKFLDDMNVVHKNSNQMDAKIRRIKADYYRKNYRDISVYELMDALEEMGVVVKDPTALNEVTMSRIDMSFGDSDDDHTMCESGYFATATANDNDFEKVCEEESLSEDIRRRMMRLNDRERTLVMKMYGIGYECEKGLDDITSEYNEEHPEKTLTEERVRQIIKGAIDKMRD